MEIILSSSSWSWYDWDTAVIFISLYAFPLQIYFLHVQFSYLIGIIKPDLYVYIFASFMNWIHYAFNSDLLIPADYL